MKIGKRNHFHCKGIVDSTIPGKIDFGYLQYKQRTTDVEVMVLNIKT